MSKNAQYYISNKAQSLPLNKEAVSFMVDGYVKNEVSDPQMAAWLTACYIHGLDDEETILLTEAMVQSGDQLTWPDHLRHDGRYRLVDKHSSGGVGDKTTLIIAPLVAAFGYPVVKLSGRSLGHTGGTIDKLESIPGLRTDLSEEEIEAQVGRIGLYIGSATDQLAPADKKMYALRDHIGLIEEPGLICSSIVSKKIASGADAFVFDIKYGQGAFMDSKDKARILAKKIEKACEYFHKPCKIILSDMNEPLGDAIGNGLEIQEVIRVLSGKVSQGPLIDLSIDLAANMLALIDPEKPDINHWKKQCAMALKNGSALQKFNEMVQAQGGDLDEALDEETEFSYDFYSGESGRITAIDAKVFGIAAHDLGAGRLDHDGIHPAAGITLDKHVGDTVFTGERIALLHYNLERSQYLYPTIDALKKAVTIDTQVEVNPFN
ncbi:thymidine phosphorylase [Peptococcus simiae]|uniref:Pyrimidine-nucleoside phosphorylase n=1 Tax=Peptococcus simiae TaxID=1643805 RepID=A0ABW9GZ28_9FIRM